MKKIKLQNGMVAKVDDDDFEHLNQYRWFAYCKARNYWVAVRKFKRPDGSWTQIPMHRDIIKPLQNMMVDHKNHDALDNRRENLRVATSSQNQHNSLLRKNNTSGYKGVYLYKPGQKWMAYIRNNGKLINLGYFSDKEDAARAYNEAARKLHGEFAYLNIIPTKDVT